jgi:hypothetical protein
VDPRTHEALSRTSRLINDQFFAGRADEERISAALPQVTIAIVSDARNAQTAGAQTVIVTLASLAARMGMSVELDCPDVPLSVPQPPLRHGQLQTALCDLGLDLVPGSAIGNSVVRAPVVTFAIGDSLCAAPGAVRLSGGDWDFEVAPTLRAGGSWDVGLPFGALACAATAAAEALRAALPHLALRAGATLVADAHRLEVGRTIKLDLRRWFPGAIGAAIGPVDAISGGAITSAAAYVLLRVPELSGAIRVIEREVLDLSNVNRYMLSRASLDGIAKTTMLTAYSTSRLSISGLPIRYDEKSIARVGPLAPRVLVGVDHIPSRWVVQREASGWVGVGATQSLEALVSGHSPGEPCAGCLHGREPDGDNLVPTISFVSFWSGLLLALELLTQAAGERPEHPSLLCWPFGYGGPQLTRLPVAPQRGCPVRCGASRAMAA